MVTTVGLMGFGRIGRNLFRQLEEHPGLAIGAVADIADPEALTYLLKYDSIYGRFRKPLSFHDGVLDVDGRKVPFIQTDRQGEVAWSDHGIDLVVIATGETRSREDCERHLAAGAEHVILAQTPEDMNDIPVLLRGINDEILDEDPPIVAMGTNTSNAIAPVLEILDNAFGVERALYTTVHAFTSSHRLGDVPTSTFRGSRAAAENIIPAKSNSAEIIAHVMPQFEGKLSAMVLNVPVPDGSTVDLVTQVETPTDVDAVNDAVKSAVFDGYGDVLDYVTDPIVSSDVVGSPKSGVFDSLATLVMGENMVKTITWFDNGWGYTARIVATLEHFNAAGGQ